MSEAILRSAEAGTPIQGDEIERAVNTAVARSIAEKLAGPGAKPPWRPRRAVWLFVAAAIAGVVAFVLLTRHHPHVSTTPTPHPSATAPPVAIPRGVTRIDPVTNRVVTTVQLDDANGKVITGDGFVWVARPEHVAKIEESSDQIVATIPADMVPAVDVGGEVWGRNATTFSRIDVRTNRVTEVSIGSVGGGGVGGRRGPRTHCARRSVATSSISSTARRGFRGTRTRASHARGGGRSSSRTTATTAASTTSPEASFQHAAALTARFRTTRFAPASARSAGSRTPRSPPAPPQPPPMQ